MFKKNQLPKTVQDVYTKTVKDLEEIHAREEEEAMLIEDQINSLTQELSIAKQEASLAKNVINNFRSLFNQA